MYKNRRHHTRLFLGSLLHALSNNNDMVLETLGMSIFLTIHIQSFLCHKCVLNASGYTRIIVLNVNNVLSRLHEFWEHLDRNLHRLTLTLTSVIHVIKSTILIYVTYICNPRSLLRCAYLRSYIFMSLLAYLGERQYAHAQEPPLLHLLDPPLLEDPHPKLWWLKSQGFGMSVVKC